MDLALSADDDEDVDQSSNLGSGDVHANSPTPVMGRITSSPPPNEEKLDLDEGGWDNSSPLMPPKLTWRDVHEAGQQYSNWTIVVSSEDAVRHRWLEHQTSRPQAGLLLTRLSLASNRRTRSTARRPTTCTRPCSPSASAPPATSTPRHGALALALALKP